jgi:hypothetical protein
MKKGLTVFFVVFLIPVILGATIDTKPEYKQGETMIAKISGNFIDTINSSNVVFYRGHVKVPMDYEVGKLGSYYYLKASLIGKVPENYSVVIEGIHYYQGLQVLSANFFSNFTVLPEQASFSVNPGFIISEKDFFIEVQNLIDSEITVDIVSPKEINSISSVKVSPQQKKIISFNFSNLSEDFSSVISFSSSSTNYDVPVYLFGKSPNAVCGNGNLEQGELCDSSNWGNITGCSDFGFSSGNLTCNIPGSYNQCRFNTADCFNSSSGEPVCGNGIIEKGEQCDKTSWGTIKACTQFGFDSGKLACIDCSFDTSNCYNYNECELARDCNAGEECINNQCKKINIECEKDNDCKYNEECIKWKCVEKKKECTNDTYCRAVDTCYNGYCIPKTRECNVTSDCDDNQICKNWACVEKGASCIYNSDCNGTDRCINNSCVDLIAEQTCSDLEGRFCNSNENCEGNYQDIRGKSCCTGNCVEVKNSLGKTIGWGLLIIILLGLIFFYFKYKKANRKAPDLLKIANKPKVKGNLFR